MTCITFLPGNINSALDLERVKTRMLCLSIIINATKNSHSVVRPLYCEKQIGDKG